MLDLTKVCGPEAGASESRRAATATSAIEVMRTKHLKQRKAERGIDTRSMQAAIKHGTKQPGNTPSTVKHTHCGVSVVTANENGNIVGVTAYKTRKAPEVPRFS